MKATASITPMPIPALAPALSADLGLGFELGGEEDDGGGRVVLKRSRSL